MYRAARAHVAAALHLDRVPVEDLADAITVAPAPDAAPRHVYLAVPWQIHAALEKRKRLAAERSSSHRATVPVPDRRRSADALLAEIARIQRELSESLEPAA